MEYSAQIITIIFLKSLLNYFKNVKKCIDFGAGIGTLASYI